MSYELISDDEFADLPAEDDRCFVEFESICRRNMTRMIDENSTNDFDQAVRQQYMTAVAAVAAECNIPNISFEPTSERHFWEQFSYFSLAVQGEVARIRIRQRGERHPYSVLLTSNTRAKIEHYAIRIRELVSASDMDRERKDRLADKLDQLIAELSNQRLGFAKTMAILVAITTTVAAASTIAAEGQSAVAHILQFIGQDKDSEDAASKRLKPPPKSLPAPQVLLATHKSNLTAEIDEDIPF